MNGAVTEEDRDVASAVDRCLVLRGSTRVDGLVQLNGEVAGQFEIWREADRGIQESKLDHRRLVAVEVDPDVLAFQFDDLVDDGTRGVDPKDNVSLRIDQRIIVARRDVDRKDSGDTVTGEDKTACSTVKGGTQYRATDIRSGNSDNLRLGDSARCRLGDLV